MKILHYVRTLTSDGAGRMIRALIGHTPHLTEVACEQDHVDLPMDGFPVHTHVGSRDLDNLLRCGGFDMIHWHWWTDLPAMKWLHESGARIPQVLTLHVYSQLPEYRLPDWVMTKVDRIGYASTRSHELACYKHLPPEKAHFIVAGVEMREALALTPQNHSGFHIGRCGALDPDNCPPDLVRIFDRVDIPGARFTVAGNGPLLEPMRQEAARSHPGRYHFPGYLPNICSLLSQLDVYCHQMPGHSRAASDLNVQEAMTAGLPVVLLPSRGCRDMVLNEVSGLVVHSEDEMVLAVQRLYEEPELREHLGRNARSYAARFFGAHNTALGYHQLYAEALSCHGRPVMGHSTVDAILPRVPAGTSPNVSNSPRPTPLGHA
ncbi:MAG: glycosyltransferase family 4 protein [Planctomycetota bacterium]